METQKSNLFFIFDKNKFDRPSCWNYSHDIVWFSIFMTRYRCLFFDICWVWRLKQKHITDVGSAQHLSYVFAPASLRLSLSRCWERGCENIWVIMYHSATVTKYVGRGLLRPSSIIWYWVSIGHWIQLQIAIGSVIYNKPRAKSLVIMQRVNTNMRRPQGRSME